MPTETLTRPTRTLNARTDTAIWGFCNQVRGRLKAENAQNNTDKELKRCLAPCVCGNYLVRLAKDMKRIGEL